LRVPESVRAPHPAVAVPVLVALELAVTAALGHGQGWPHSAGRVLVAGVLLTAQMLLLYAVAHVIGGRGPAVAAGLLLALVPVVLAKRYFIIGGGGIDYKTVYRHEVLPTEVGLVDRTALVAACLLLLSAWLALARTPLPAWAGSGLAGLAAAAAAVTEPHVWPALAAPVLAAAFARRVPAVAAAAAGAGCGLIALALFRHVPHVPFGWHSMGITLGGVREFTWSRRLLEYLPLAGLIGLARRSAPAAGFFGALLVAVVILPLSRNHDFTAYLLSIVPGLPVYMLLTASIGFLVPRRRIAPAPAAQPVSTRQ
jgi:hypothetical protein